ncbi:chorion peroxidase [Trichonephila clavipes]|nr:chorion peroxidase [Trichonephila clavipes]
MLGYQGSRIKCCGVEKQLFHPECYPIRIPTSDPVFGRRNQNCMEYTRSCTAPRIGCTLGPREQINQVTSFLDASVVYGSSVSEANALRTFKGGELKTQRTPAGRELLPPDTEQSYCKTLGKSRCFLAGDIRVNENAGLIVMHTVWVREHNRLARSLATLNPHWDDHQLFEEARRIVGAELQHITYKELLPAILGQDIMDKYDLQPQGSGHYTGYDINLNAGVSNAVASSVFSFLFSMMPSHFELYSKEYKKVGSKPMSETFFQPSDMYDSNKLNEYLLGLVSQKAQNRDEFISKEMTNNIFTDTNTAVEARSLHIGLYSLPQEEGLLRQKTPNSLTHPQEEINFQNPLAKCLVKPFPLFRKGLVNCQVIYSQFGLAIHQNDHQARRRFVEWAQNEIDVVPDFHKKILFSDDVHFWLNGYVNKQNCRIWSEANPQVYVETPLHPEKLTVWCALWAGGIIGPYFFKNDEGHNVAVNGDRYRAMITNFFIPELNSHDVQELWFPTRGAQHVTQLSLVYADKPQTLDHLEDNIRRVIADIRPQMLEKVIENWTSRLDYIRASRGSPMPEII